MPTKTKVRTREITVTETKAQFSVDVDGERLATVPKSNDGEKRVNKLVKFVRDGLRAKDYKTKVIRVPFNG